MRIVWTCVALMLMALACRPAMATDLDGYWYGEGYPPYAHQTLQWLTQFPPDGTYHIEFREYISCDPARVQIEDGTWTVDGDRMLMVTKAIDGHVVAAGTDIRDDYVIEELSAQQLRLR